MLLLLLEEGPGGRWSENRASHSGFFWFSRVPSRCVSVEEDGEEQEEALSVRHGDCHDASVLGIGETGVRSMPGQSVHVFGGAT